MRPGTIALLHSPFTGIEVWGPLPELLRGQHHDVRVLEVSGDDQPPFAQRYVAAAATELAARSPLEPLVLLGHGAAGPLLPQVGFARRSSHRPVGGYVFFDASLPRAAGATGPATRMSLIDGDQGSVEVLRRELATYGAAPRWNDELLYGEIPDPGDRAAVLAGARPRGQEFYTEPLPFPGDWPDAPCGYLHTSAGHDRDARLAVSRRWPTARLERGHFASLAAPAETAMAITDLIERM